MQRLSGMLYVDDVMKLLNFESKKPAYKVIKELNKELEEKGYMVRQGAVSRKYFLERYYMEDKKNDNTAKSRDEKKSPSL